MLAAAACNSSEGLGSDNNTFGEMGGAKDSVGSLSSGWAPGMVELRASTDGLFSDFGRNVTSCVTQSINGLFRCNHEYPRTIVVERAKGVRRSRML